MEKLQIVLDSVGCMYRVSMEKLQMLYSSFHGEWGNFENFARARILNAIFGQPT